MVQHVRIVLNSEGKPVAESAVCNIWRDDQQIAWMFTEEVKAAGWGWNNDGPDPVIQFKTLPLAWQGSIPAPVGEFVNILQDTRLYTATGPGAINGDGETERAYGYFLNFKNKNDQAVFRHDPEIGNQPQP
jgi:hypothetical protein